MGGEYQKVAEARDFLAQRLGHQPRIGIVLGSGLSEACGQLEDRREIPFEDIPHWPRGDVAGHGGAFAAGKLGRTPVAVLLGRVHLYEGHPASAVVFGVRVLGLLGVRSLILTNAAGAIQPSWQPGSLALIRDHLNLQGVNPLAGPNEERFGPRFPDLSEPYCGAYRQAAQRAAAELGIELLEGVYAAVLGPSYETPAEIRYLRTIGADMVGMSTVPETIAARHMGMKVLAVSVITNKAAGIGGVLSHEEVLATGKQALPRLTALVRAVAPRLEG